MERYFVTLKNLADLSIESLVCNDIFYQLETKESFFIT